MNFEHICRLYGIGIPRTCTPMTSGTVSRAWKVETDNGTYLLRTLTGKEQGEKEWAIVSHLAARGFFACPALLPTLDGAACIEADGTWYQVQEFRTGDMPDPALPGVAGAIGQVAKELSAALSDFPGGPLIHGDLGPWNMLLDDSGNILVIDFGEAHPGDPYYDFATALAGIINHTGSDRRIAACREYLSVLQPERPHLLAQLRTWAEDGVERWKDTGDTMTARFYNALNWAEENLYEL